MEFVEIRGLRRRTTIAVVVAVCHTMLALALLSPMLVLQKQRPPLFSILHLIRQHIKPIRRPLIFSNFLSAPPAPFVPPPEIRIKPPPPSMPNLATPQTVKVLGYSQLAGPGNAVTGGDSVTKHAVFSGAQPEYPGVYRSLGRSGYVEVICTILTDGRATGCTLITVKGGDAFGAAVISWLQGNAVYYRPATKNGKPIAEMTALKIHFSKVP